MITEKEFWSEKIPFIKKLKEFFSKIEYQGINLWPVMANDVYTYYKNQEDRTEKEIFLETLKDFILIDKYRLLGEKGRILATYFMGRRDHHEFFLKSLSSFNKGDLTVLDFYNDKIKTPLKRSKLTFPNLVLLLRLLRKFKEAKLKSLLGRYYFLFIAKTYLRYNQIRQFHKIYKKYLPQGYIGFCPASFPEEAILTQIAKSHQVQSFSLQHGFYDIHKKFSPVVVQSENVITDYLLLWGKYSYNVQKNYLDKSRLIIAGNPKYGHPEEHPSQIFDPKRAAVFLSVTGFVNSNKDIVSVVNIFAKNHPEIEIAIKIHPFDKKENYLHLISEKNIHFLDREYPASKLLEESDFVVTHSTTIEIESLLYGIPILRFNDKNSKPFWKDLGDKFSNLKELETVFKSLKDRKKFSSLLNFYRKELLNHFYFEPNKKVSEVYKEKIMARIQKG